MNKLTNVPLLATSNDDSFHIQNLKLCVPYLYKSGQIDLILGVDFYTDLLLDGIVRGSQNSPSPISFKLEYLFSGQV